MRVCLGERVWMCYCIVDCCCRLLCGFNPCFHTELLLIALWYKETHVLSCFSLENYTLKRFNNQPDIVWSCHLRVTNYLSDCLSVSKVMSQTDNSCIFVLWLQDALKDQASHWARRRSASKRSKEKEVTAKGRRLLGCQRLHRSYHTFGGMIDYFMFLVLWLIFEWFRTAI